MLEKHNKVLFMRLDVRYPEDHTTSSGNEDFSKFISNWTQDRRRHDLDAHTLWVREQSREKHQHYHCAVFMDGNKTQHIQDHVDKAEDIWERTIDRSDVNGLVDDCTKSRAGEPQRNGIMLRRDDPQLKEKIDECFRWGSYLAKTATKGYGPKGSRDYSCSSIPKSSKPK